MFPFYFNILTLAKVVALGVIAYSFIKKRRDIVPTAGFAVLALLFVICFFRNFSTGAYEVIVYSYWTNEYRFDFLCMLPSLLETVGYVGAALIAAVGLTDYLPKYKEKIKKLWFVPAACILGKIVLAIIVRLLLLFIRITGYVCEPLARLSFGSIVSTLVLGAAVLLAAGWIVYPDGLPKKSFAQNDPHVTSAASVNESYCSLVKHILLLLFTFGVWELIWIYRTTGYTNNVEGEEDRSPTTKLLLCLFVPFYRIFWTYKTAQRVDKIAKARGIPSDISTLCLILEIFVAIVPPILIQDKMNAVATAAVPSGEAGPSEKTSANTRLGVAEELKAYKDLLDSGAITQEEFDEKKKQLLKL